MPLLGLGEEGFDPHLPLAQNFFVGFSRLVSADAIQAGLIDTAAEGPSLFARGTLRFERAVVAVFGACSVTARALSRMRLIKAQFFACRTDIQVALGLIAEALDAKVGRPMIKVR